MRTILFDLDGTLIDTAPEIHQYLNYASQTLGYSPLPLAKVRSAISEGGTAIIEQCFADTLSPHEKDQLKAVFFQTYLQNSLNSDNAQPFPGILDLIDSLKSLNILWGIVTNRTTVLSEWMAEKHPFLREAHCWVSADTTDFAKPHPAPLLHACEQLNANPAHAFYLGDANTDIEAAKRAGMIAILAAYGYGAPNQDPLEWKPDFSVTHPNEILSLIKT